jgi:hypothetical protein
VIWGATSQKRPKPWQDVRKTCLREINYFDG